MFVNPSSNPSMTRRVKLFLGPVEIEARLPLAYPQAQKQEDIVIKKRPMNSEGREVERRKSRRFGVTVPVEVSWRGSNGLALKEEATARQANENGAFLKMSKYPDVGTRVTLANFLSAQTAEARVLASPNSRSGVAGGIVVELVVPNEVFWGIDLQMNKTVVELQNLENALKTQDVDQRLIREYRSAIDNICSLMDTLRQHRVSTASPSDDQEALRDLAEDRVRRSNQLCMDVIADIDAGRIPDNAASVQELSETVLVLQQRFKKIGKSGATPVNRSRVE
ncbi:MAG TPA: hypothetical protein VHP80_12135 [Candidatus Acidoferrum sp.]|nr:hypothetical protein [Candidatus Acidoferrum sp.]